MFLKKNRKVINSYTKYQLQGYHLGQNKTGQQIHVPPKQGLSRAKAKKRQFPIVDFGERLGGGEGGGWV